MSSLQLGKCPIGRPDELALRLLSPRVMPSICVRDSKTSRPHVDHDVDEQEVAPADGATLLDPFHDHHVVRVERLADPPCQRQPSCSSCQRSMCWPPGRSGYPAPDDVVDAGPFQEPFDTAYLVLNIHFVGGSPRSRAGQGSTETRSFAVGGRSGIGLTLIVAQEASVTSRASMMAAATSDLGTGRDQ